jgi:hypothetical protein
MAEIAPSSRFYKVRKSKLVHATARPATWRCPPSHGSTATKKKKHSRKSTQAAIQCDGDHRGHYLLANRRCVVTQCDCVAELKGCKAVSRIINETYNCRYYIATPPSSRPTTVVAGKIYFMQFVSLT